MKVTTEYDLEDLHKGKCSSCGDHTWVTSIDKCPDCIDAEAFYEMTMNGVDLQEDANDY